MPGWAQVAGRRGVSRFVACSVAAAWAVLVLVLVAGAAAGPGSGWPQFRFDPAHTGFNPGESVVGVGNVAELQEWLGSVGSQVESSPAVAGGVVFVGGQDGRLYAFDAAGLRGCGGSPKVCAPLWSGLTGGAVESSPTVANGVVYVGSDDHSLYAFDAAGVSGCSGSPKSCLPLWTAPTGDRVLTPAVANGVVYVGSADHDLYAFDAAGESGCSGSPKSCLPLWTASTGGQVFSSPAVADGLVYLGGRDGRLYAFDAAGTRGCSGTPKTCAPLWTASARNGASVASASAAGGVVYAGASDQNLYALSTAGTLLWTADTGADIFDSPAVADGIVYVDTFNVNTSAGSLFAFDASGTIGCAGVPKSCTPLWTAPVDEPIASAPSVANGVVYVGSAYGDLYAFDAAGESGCSGDPKTCAPLWTTAIGGAGDSSPAVAGGVVYVGSLDGNLHAFALDADPPLTVAQLSGTAGLNGWYTSPVQVTVSASDDRSGVAQTRCLLDPKHVPAGFDQLPAACPFTGLGAEIDHGQHTLYFASRDNYGNKEPVRNTTVKIDRGAPSVQLSASGTVGENGWYLSSVSVHTSGSDAGSGIASCTPDQVFSAETAGTIVNGSCTDQAGLVGTAAPLKVHIDLTAPSVAITITPASPDGLNGWYRQPPKLKVKGDDNISGIAETRCILDPPSVPTSYADLPASCPYLTLTKVTADGPHDIYAASNDRAGHTSAVEQLAWKRDHTPPILKCAATPNRLTPSDHRLARVTTGIISYDNLSGLNALTLLGVTSSQPDSGLGPDDRPNDIQGWTPGSLDIVGLLRAEAYATTRVYTLTYQAHDHAGNVRQCTPKVNAPQS